MRAFPVGLCVSISACADSWKRWASLISVNLKFSCSPALLRLVIYCLRTICMYHISRRHETPGVLS